MEKINYKGSILEDRIESTNLDKAIEEITTERAVGNFFLYSHYEGVYDSGGDRYSEDFINGVSVDQGNLKNRFYKILRDKIVSIDVELVSSVGLKNRFVRIVKVQSVAR